MAVSAHPLQFRPKLVPRGRYARVAMWGCAVGVLALLTLYLMLLMRPLPLPFVRAQAQAAVLANLPESFDLELGDTSLSLENGLWPAIRFSPVQLTDHQSGAVVKMDALEVGFSPLQALVGQPAATVTLDGAHLQVVQDLLGPRLASFELVDDPDTGAATIRVLEGETVAPAIGILAQGLEYRGPLPEGAANVLRSDNDWLIYNMEATENALAELMRHSADGRFSRLRVRNATIDMHDAVYGLFRQLQDVQADIKTDRAKGTATGQFEATLAGRKTTGSFSRTVQNGQAHFVSEVDDIDFAAILPFIDDPDGVLALKGVGDLDVDVSFGAADGKVESGEFGIDLTGTELRIQSDYFPVTTDRVEVSWNPAGARFDMKEAAISVGQSSARLSGVFLLGLDDAFGPTLSMSMRAEDLLLHPDDLDAPDEPFREVTFSGWSAPLYGAVGIDHLRASKPGVEVRTKGRVDMLRRGMGVDLEIGGEGASADDLKRLWPYFLSTRARQWFVENVRGGTVLSSAIRFDFPVGTISTEEEERPVPEGSISIDMIGTDVSFTPMEGFDPIPVVGKTRVSIRDAIINVGLDGAAVPTDEGPISVTDARLVLDSRKLGTTGYDISGDVAGTLGSFFALADKYAPQVLSGDLPMAPHALSGHMSGRAQSRFSISEGAGMSGLSYSVAGNITNFASTEPLQGRTVSNGDLEFSVDKDGYRVTGKADVDGLTADLSLEGALTGDADVKLGATVDVADFAKYGVDLSDFLAGRISFTATPQENDSLLLRVDVEDARLAIDDVGLQKARGVPGVLEAEVSQKGTRVEASKVKLSFEEVRLEGDVTFDTEEGLVAADFSRFRLSAGDDAQLSIEPDGAGIKLRVRGNQLDLKPMLRRFFALDQASTGGPQASQFSQTIKADIALDRAVGFYRTTAYNFRADLTVRGENILDASLQAQFGEGSSVSVTTNPLPTGRVMSVAFNDAGTLLRFANVYPRLLGGSGSMVLSTNTSQRVDIGQLHLRNFSIVDEQNVAQVLGNHRDSRRLIANGNRVDFDAARVDFLRRSDRIEVTNAVLSGDMIGGTMRGFVYTKARKYDLTGTYVPLFGLNSIFQKLPILGPILGGRDGEGLVGVTFAVRGDLDQPNFLINPASLLAPGVFRSIFEFRAKEAPRAGQQQ